MKAHLGLGEETALLFFVFPQIFIFSFLEGNGSDGGITGLDPSPNSDPGMPSAPGTSYMA